MLETSEEKLSVLTQAFRILKTFSLSPLTVASFKESKLLVWSNSFENVVFDKTSKATESATFYKPVYSQTVFA